MGQYHSPPCPAGLGGTKPGQKAARPAPPAAGAGAFAFAFAVAVAVTAAGVTF